MRARGGFALVGDREEQKARSNIISGIGGHEVSAVNSKSAGWGSCCCHDKRASGVAAQAGSERPGAKLRT